MLTGACTSQSARRVATAGARSPNAPTIMLHLGCRILSSAIAPTAADTVRLNGGDTIDARASKALASRPLIARRGHVACSGKPSTVGAWDFKVQRLQGLQGMVS